MPSVGSLELPLLAQEGSKGLGIVTFQKGVGQHYGLLQHETNGLVLSINHKATVASVSGASLCTQFIIIPYTVMSLCGKVSVLSC